MKATASPALGTSATRAATLCIGPSFKEFNFSVFKDTTLAEHVTHVAPR